MLCIFLSCVLTFSKMLTTILKPKTKSVISPLCPLVAITSGQTPGYRSKSEDGGPPNMTKQNITIIFIHYLVLEHFCLSHSDIFSSAMVHVQHCMYCGLR